jgi:hypothetical protein
MAAKLVLEPIFRALVVAVRMSTSTPARFLVAARTTSQATSARSQMCPSGSQCPPGYKAVPFAGGESRPRRAQTIPCTTSRMTRLRVGCPQVGLQRTETHGIEWRLPLGRVARRRCGRTLGDEKRFAWATRSVSFAASRRDGSASTLTRVEHPRRETKTNIPPVRYFRRRAQRRCRSAAPDRHPASGCLAGRMKRDRH